MSNAPTAVEKKAVEWIQSLSSPAPSARLEAALALGELGGQAAEAVSALIRAIDDGDKYVGRAAVIALGRIGSCATAAVPALVKVLKGDDVVLRAKAYDAIKLICPDTSVHLIEGLDSDSEECRDEIVRSLLAARQTAKPELIAALQDPRTTVRLAVAQILGLIGPEAASAVPGLIALIRDSSLDVRRCAVVALWRIDPLAIRAFIKSLAAAGNDLWRDHFDALVRLGSDGEAVVPALIEALKDEEALVRGLAACALGELGDAATSAASEISGLLNDSDPRVQRWAAVALWRMGPIAVGEVVELVRTEEDTARRIYRALVNIGNDGNVAIPELIQSLECDFILVRELAAYALANCGQQAVPFLCRELQNKNVLARCWAAFAIAEIGSSAAPAFELLVALSHDHDASARAMAAKALGSIGPGASVACADLVRLLHDEYDFVCEAAARALRQIRPEPLLCVPALRAALSHDSPAVRAAAASSLGTFWDAATESVSDLIAMLRDSDAQCQAEAAYSLLRVCRRPPTEVLPFLTAWLQGSRDDLRGDSAWALGRMGLDASPAVSLLLDALNDSDFTTRVWSAWALEQMHRDSMSALWNEIPGKVQRQAEHVSKYSGRIFRETIAALLEGLSHPDEYVQRHASEVLDGNTEAEAVIPNLIEKLGAVDPVTRTFAVFALGSIGRGASHAAPRILPLLRESDSIVRAKSAWGLGRIKGRGAEVVQNLVEVLADPDERVRREAACALGCVPLQDEEQRLLVGRALVGALVDKCTAVRVDAAYALGSVSVPETLADATVHALAGNLTAEHVDVRAAAAFALVHMSVMAWFVLQRGESDDPYEKADRISRQAMRQIAPALKERLSDEDRFVRARCALVLERMSSSVLHDIPVTTRLELLLIALREDVPIVRFCTAQVLGQFQTHLDKIVSVLVEMLDERDANVRRSCICALGDIGSAAKAALPALRSLAETDHSCYEAAQHVIEKISKEGR